MTTALKELNELKRRATVGRQQGAQAVLFTPDEVLYLIAQLEPQSAPAGAVVQEPITHLRYRCGNGNHDIQHGEWLEVCEPDEKSDDGAPAFPVYSEKTFAPALEADVRDALMKAVAPFVDLAYAAQDRDMVAGNDDDVIALSAVGAWSSATVTNKECRELEKAYRGGRWALKEQS